MKTSNYRKELTSVSISQAIILLVETALLRGTLNKVMVVQVSFDFDNITTDKHFREFLHFVIFRPGNYTFVGACDFDRGFMDLTSETKITRKSYHDSCWKSDGIESTLYKNADKINQEISSSPDWSICVSFGLFGAKIYEGTLENTDSFEEGAVRFVSLKVE